MCGLVGLVGDFRYETPEIFQRMLRYDMTRGLDSTGILIVNDLGKTTIDKEEGPPDFLWWGRDKRDLYDFSGKVKGNNMALLGHNRHATIGKVSVDTAHPFQFGSIIGMHNGTLKNYNKLVGYKDHETDSQSLIHTIAEKGIEETWASFTGAAAIVWWDENDSTLNFIRNSKRPLVCACDDRKTTMFYASEWWMMRDAVKKSHFTKIRSDKDNRLIYYNAKENVHHKIKVESNGYKILSMKELKPMEEIHTISYLRGYNSHYDSKWKTGAYRSPKLNNVNTVEKSVNNKYATLGWSKNLVKADKDMVGKKLKLSNHYHPFRSLRVEHELIECLVLRPEDPNDPVHVVHAIPCSYNQKQEIRDIIRLDSDPRFEIKVRPRVFVSRRDGDVDIPTILRVSMSGIRHIKPTKKVEKVKEEHKLLPMIGKKKEPTSSTRLYTDRNGIATTKEAIQKQINEAGGTCAYCSESIIPEDIENCQWLDRHTILCEECKYDKFDYPNMGMMKSMYM